VRPAREGSGSSNGISSATRWVAGLLQMRQMSPRQFEDTKWAAIIRLAPHIGIADDPLFPPLLPRLAGRAPRRRQRWRAAENPDPNDLILGYHARRSTAQTIVRQEARRAAKAPFFRFCREQGVAALVEPSDCAHGILHADGSGQIPTYMRRGDEPPVASFVVAREQFGRLARLVERGRKPKIRLCLSARFFDETRYNVNVLISPGATPRCGRRWFCWGRTWTAGTPGRARRTTPPGWP
jgi:hypothetical protein